MVVTLPIMMILLDYWPLRRFESHKSNVFLWQLKEKLPFLILSIIFSIITLAAQPHSTSMRFPLFSRLANAPVSFVTYIGKTFWPLDMAVFYPFETQIHTWQVWGTTSLIVMISLFVIVMAKRCPYLFVGWLWYAISLAPVIGIIQVGNHALADRYHYLPSIGISMMIAWGLPALINNLNIRNNIVLPAAILFLTMMAFLSFKQCGYWGNDFELFNHAARVTQNNDLALNNRGVFYGERGQYQLAIKDFKQVMSHDPHRLRTYYNLGLVHTQIGQYQKAIHYINAAIRLKSDYADAYFLRGFTYYHMGQYKRALDDYSRAIHIKPDYSDSYCNRAAVYFQQSDNQKGCLDAQKACSLGNCKSLESAKAMGLCQ